MVENCLEIKPSSQAGTSSLDKHLFVRYITCLEMSFPLKSKEHIRTIQTPGAIWELSVSQVRGAFSIHKAPSNSDLFLPQSQGQTGYRERWGTEFHEVPGPQIPRSKDMKTYPTLTPGHSARHSPFALPELCPATCTLRLWGYASNHNELNDMKHVLRDVILLKLLMFYVP